jgi:hypothetical protein
MTDQQNLKAVETALTDFVSPPKAESSVGIYEMIDDAQKLLHDAENTLVRLALRLQEIGKRVSEFDKKLNDAHDRFYNSGRRK